MKKISALILLAVLCVSPVEAAVVSADTPYGIFDGFVSDDVITWLGVPYAKPPVNALRWKAPESPDKSTEHVSADAFGPMPIQIPGESHPASLMAQDEDCLYLNVWKASDDSTALKPVMVWIHGGSFKSNGTGDPEYTGHNFAKAHDDVIFVSIGYRLGLMGFIDFSQIPGGSDYPDSGNLGLLDILQGVRWLKENIASFGGDPGNITLFGQSSGAASIALIMTMPEARGLFQRAILESGAVSMSTKSSDCVPLAGALLKLTGKTDMAGLMSVSSQDLQNAAEKLDALMNFPELDGRVLTSGDIYTAFTQNAGNFDVFIGSNADEVRYWLGALDFNVASFDAFITTAFTQIKEGITAINPDAEAVFDGFLGLHADEEAAWTYAEFFNELFFRLPAVAMAKAHAASGGTGKTYMYYWEYYADGVNDVLDILKACHSYEIAYVLNNPTTLVPEAVLNASAPLAGGVQDIWVNFAKTGQISYNTYTANTYTADNTETLILPETGTLVESGDPIPAQTQLLTPLLAAGMSGRELITALSATPDAEEDITPDTAQEQESDPAQENNPDTKQDNTQNGNPDTQKGDGDNTLKDTGTGPGDSSGGCNYGMTAIMLLLMIPAVISRKRR